MDVDADADVSVAVDAIPLPHAFPVGRAAELAVQSKVGAKSGSCCSLGSANLDGREFGP